MTATEDVRRELTDLINADPSLEVTLDIEHLEIRAGNHTFPASLPSSAQQALTEGRWDPIAELLGLLMQHDRLTSLSPTPPRQKTTAT